MHVADPPPARLAATLPAPLVPAVVPRPAGPSAAPPMAPTVPAGPAAGPVAPRRAGLLADLLALVRPAQWAKNLLVVPLPLLDAADWTLGALWRVAWAVAVFTLASAVVYVGNDIADRHRDRRHPAKRHRPIAAGRVPVGLACGYAVGLGAVLVLLLRQEPVTSWWPVLGYLALNVAYSRRLKHLPLIDVGTVATGFVLRVVQGYLATGEPVSGWLVVTVFALCLLLILGKRRHELLVSGTEHRPALRGYSVALADQLLLLNAVLAVTAGLLYLRTEAPVEPYAQAALLISTPFALFALARYLQAVLVRRGGGDPVRTLLADRALVGAGLLWGLLLGGTLVLARHPALAERLLP